MRNKSETIINWDLVKEMKDRRNKQTIPGDLEVRELVKKGFDENWSWIGWEVAIEKLIEKKIKDKEQMNKECTCGERFMDAEDYRSHLPCEGGLQEKLERANERIKELEEIVLSPEENDILYIYQTEGVRGSDEDMERIMKKLMNFSIAKKPIKIN